MSLPPDRRSALDTAIWGAAGVVFIADDAYGWALYAFAMMGLVLVQLVSLRRRGRRLEAAARALGT